MIMSWIYGMIFILIQISSNSVIRNQHVAYATPLQSVHVPSQINTFIRHWEPAHFNRDALEQAHRVHETNRRRKREINYNHFSPHYGSTNVIKFSFNAHDREFRIEMREDPTSVFASGIVIENSDGPLDFDVSRVYTGKLEDDENSHVHGVLTADKLFDGTITTGMEQYYIEPSMKYSEELHKNGIHTIIYKSQDHQDPPLPLDLETPYTRLNVNVNSELNSDEDQYQSDQAFSPTTSTSNVHRNILINSYNPNSDYNLRNIITKTNRNVLSNVFNDGTSRINNNFTATNQQMNINSRPNHKTHVEIITKNGPTKKPNVIVNNYNPDLIYANSNPPHNNKHHPSNNQYPHLYHPQHNVNLNIKNDIMDMLNTKPSTSGSLADRKSTCMLYLQADHTFFQKLGSDEASIEAITRHVQRANVIYKNTDFNSDGKPDNITFMIKRIKIHNMNALKDPSYRFPGNYGVEKFLELFSEEDYDQFCLAYMFTYRDFEMGTLGLAWTGDLKNAGGVCEKNGHYRGSLKSLNTGIVTLLNYGKHVPPAVSHVTLAHEIGHNFGSPHDPDQCTPGGEDGNFIMFARATSGDKRNNNKFSPCSLKAIEPVLNAKARSSKGCFTEPTQSICGNGVVEPGEQCDCGWEEDCKDNCCFPMSRHPAYNERPCTLKPEMMCSPSQGPCCKSDCSLKYGDKCRDDNGCREPSYCDGRSAICPPSVNKPNKTICNKEFVCYMGECTGSICLAYGLESCQCIPGENDPKTKSCELCCKKPGENQECKSSFEWNKAPYDVPDMYSKPGTPCNDYNGYCDVFQRCREVDPSGPLATLRKLLLSEESIASFKKWVISNWYAVSLIIVAVFALLILSTRFLGKKSNLKLKTVTIIHSATTETVRLPDDNNGVIVHTAVRTKVPLKKKVRGERNKKKLQQQKLAAQQQQQLPKDVIPTNITANPLNQTLPVSATSTKPSSRSQKKSLESPKKLLRRKKKHRQPASGTDDQMKVKDDQHVQQQSLPVKPQRTKPKKKPSSASKHKEIIDYSNPESHTNTFGKVQKWLLESPIVLTTASQIEHESKTSNIMNKSHSTPDHLANAQQQQQRSPMNTAKPKAGAVGAAANDKVRLQVVYKPPFKFSLKFSKNKNSVKTNVAGADKSKLRRQPQLQQQQAAKRNSLEDPTRSRRAALLIRSATEDISNKLVNDEPLYETLSHPPKVNKQHSMPNYENLPTTSSTVNLIDSSMSNSVSSPINTATFRVNKSASGSNINNHRNLPVISTPILNNSKKQHYQQQRGSQSNLRRSSIGNSGSSGNLMKFGGSSQNLTRSSTTNLTKHSQKDGIKRRASDMNRSSTTNLHKYNRHGSNSNLRRGGSNMDINSSPSSEEYNPMSSNERKSHSRKNSINVNGSRSSLLSKTYSNSNLVNSNNNNTMSSNGSTAVCPVPGSSRRESFNNNIPRASLINSITNISNPFQRQTSLKPTQPLSHSSRMMIDELNKNRPQTSSCDSSMFKNFEWPKVLTTQRSLPADNAAMQSDLEVMVSDVENLMNDS